LTSIPAILRTQSSFHSILTIPCNTFPLETTSLLSSVGNSGGASALLVCGRIFLVDLNSLYYVTNRTLFLIHPHSWNPNRNMDNAWVNNTLLSLSPPLPSFPYSSFSHTLDLGLYHGWSPPHIKIMVKPGCGEHISSPLIPTPTLYSLFRSGLPPWPTYLHRYGYCWLQAQR